MLPTIGVHCTEICLQENFCAGLRSLRGDRQSVVSWLKREMPDRPHSHVNHPLLSPVLQPSPSSVCLSFNPTIRASYALLRQAAVAVIEDRALTPKKHVVSLHQLRPRWHWDWQLWRLGLTYFLVQFPDKERLSSTCDGRPVCPAGFTVKSTAKVSTWWFCELNTASTFGWSSAAFIRSNCYLRASGSSLVGGFANLARLRRQMSKKNTWWWLSPTSPV